MPQIGGRVGMRAFGRTIVPWMIVAAVVVILVIAASSVLLYLRDTNQVSLDYQTSPTMPGSTSAAPVVQLTDAERAWLRDHPVIRVVQDPAWPPVEFADEQGRPSGTSEDYVRLIEQRLGIRFERVTGLSWQTAYERLKRWEIDMTGSVAVTSERVKFW